MQTSILNVIHSHYTVGIIEVFQILNVIHTHYTVGIIGVFQILNVIHTHYTVGIIRVFYPHLLVKHTKSPHSLYFTRIKIIHYYCFSLYSKFFKETKKNNHATRRLNLINERGNRPSCYLQ